MLLDVVGATHGLDCLGCAAAARLAARSSGWAETPEPWAVLQQVDADGYALQPGSVPAHAALLVRSSSRVGRVEVLPEGTRIIRELVPAEDEAQQLAEQAEEAAAPRRRLVDRRDPECVKAWPGCGSFEYDPRCCRFPKSCSAGSVELEEVDRG